MIVIRRDREKPRIPVPRGWFYPASRLYLVRIPNPFSILSPIPRSCQTYVGPVWNLRWVEESKGIKIIMQ